MILVRGTVEGHLHLGHLSLKPDPTAYMYFAITLHLAIIMIF